MEGPVTQQNFTSVHKGTITSTSTGEVIEKKPLKRKVKFEDEDPDYEPPQKKGKEEEEEIIPTKTKTPPAKPSINYDKMFITKMKNCVEFLSGIDALKENPSFIQHMSMFCIESNLGLFKKWFKEQIMPQMQPKGTLSNFDMAERLFLNYNILSHKTTQEQKTKLARYIECFTAIINKAK
jgi:hypothetical protein